MSSFAGVEKVIVEGKTAATVTQGDSDKPKDSPNPEGKEEAPVAAATQPKEPAEQADAKEGPAESQQAGGEL